MADTNVKVLIEAILKDEGFKKAIVSVENIDKTLRKTERRMEMFEGAAKKAGAALAGMFAVSEIKRFGQESLTTFATLERGYNVIANQIERMGGNAEEAVPQIREAMEAISFGGGSLQADTIPAFQKMLGITGSVATALEATGLAADIAEKGQMSAASAAEALANIMQGRASEAAKQLDIALVDQNGHIRDNGEIMAAVIEKYRGLGNELGDTRNKLDALAGGWEQVKSDVGSAISAVFDWMLAVGQFGFNLQNSLRAAGASVVYIVQAALQNLGELGAFLTDPSRWNPAGIKAATDKAAAVMEKAFKDSQQRIVDAWSELERGKTEQAKANAEAQAALVEQANAKQRALEAEKRRKEEEAEAEKRKREAERDEKHRTEKAKRDAEKAHQSLLEQLRDYEDFIAAKIAAEEKAQRDREGFNDDTIREIARQNIDMAETEQERRAAEIRALELERKERMEEAHRLGADEGAVAALYDDRLLMMKRRYAQADIAIEKAKAKQKEEIYLDSAQIALGALQTLFGENKAFGVAQAIIDTYRGANAALAMGPIGIPIAAAIILQGLANVKKIMSTEPGGSNGGGDATKGSGFDSPANDRAARMGGTRWANDMIREFGIGATPALAAGWSSGMGGTTTNSTVSGDTYNVSISGTVIDDRAIRMLDRKLNVARRRDQGRFIR